MCHLQWLPSDGDDGAFRQLRRWLRHHSADLPPRHHVTLLYSTAKLLREQQAPQPQPSRLPNQLPPQQQQQQQDTEMQAQQQQQHTGMQSQQQQQQPVQQQQDTGVQIQQEQEQQQQQDTGMQVQQQQQPSQQQRQQQQGSPHSEMQSGTLAAGSSTEMPTLGHQHLQAVSRNVLQHSVSLLPRCSSQALANIISSAAALKVADLPDGFSAGGGPDA